MFKNVAAVSLATVSIVGFVKYFEASQEARQELASQSQIQAQQSQQIAQTHQQVSVVQTQPQSNEQPLSGRKARIKMDARGHFYTEARMNGRRIPVLVDTGATSVAINKSTAREMGIRLTDADFKYAVNTANGKTRAAATVIKRVEIGRVRVNNVRAMVLDDSSLSSTLLGMSFLGELKSFGVKNRQLVLEQ